jgi:hypothetical protein
MWRCVESFCFYCHDSRNTVRIFVELLLTVGDEDTTTVPNYTLSHTRRLDSSARPRSCEPRICFRRMCQRSTDRNWLRKIQGGSSTLEVTSKYRIYTKVNKKFISHITRAQRTPSVAAAVQVSHALPVVRFSCLLRGRGASFQDGVAAGNGFLCAPFWGVQFCDYGAAWVSCTV